ncbi:Os08g0165300, partial [Oryza sativa Japonica Group]
ARARRRSARKGRLGMCLSSVAATSPLLHGHRSPAQLHRCSLSGRKKDRERKGRGDGGRSGH